VWRQADRYRVPRLAFINKMDRNGARFAAVVEEMRRRLAADAWPIQLPIGEQGDFAGVVDLVGMRARYWDRDALGVNIREGPVPPELSTAAQEARRRLLERLAERDDLFLADYLAGGELPPARVLAAIRAETLAGRLVPVLCGSAARNKGIQPLLDAVVDYLPSPADLPPCRAWRPVSGEATEVRAAVEGPLAALVFKTVSDPYAGRLAYLRVYSGRLAAGDTVFSSGGAQRERVQRLLRMHANEREPIGEVRAGDIAAAVGLRKATTGDTLCDEREPVLLERMQFPQPVVSMAIEPKRQVDAGRLAEALGRLAEEDPTFRVHLDPETGQTVISGMGELHLEIAVERLAREHQVAAGVGSPQVAFRETIVSSAEAEGRFERREALRAQYGHVVVRFEPLPAGSGFRFVDASDGGIPSEYVAAVEQGLEESRSVGVLAGYPVVDFQATLLAGSYRALESSELAFRIAASLAYKRGLEKAVPVLQEPVMAVEVFTPEEYLGELVADLLARTGRVEEIEDRPGGKLVRARVPLRCLFGFTTRLRTLSRGRAAHALQFDSYHGVPRSVQEQIVRKVRGTFPEKRI
jgi:elongation factor G